MAMELLTSPTPNGWKVTISLATPTRPSRFESMPMLFARRKPTSHSLTSVTRDGPIRPNPKKTIPKNRLTPWLKWHAGRDSTRRCAP